MSRQIKKDDVINVYHPNKQQFPARVRVIAITPLPGKTIGVMFDQNVGGHSCDGRGPDGHCLWVAPHHILTDEQVAQLMAMKRAEAQSRAPVPDNMVLEIDETGKSQLKEST
jgi:hypothetical protein